MKRREFGLHATGLAVAIALAVGVSQTASAAQSVNVGLSSAFTGPIATLGETNEHGIELAIDKINADGGLLGKQIKLVTADSEAKPATGVSNVRNFILNDHVKALFGPVSSAVGAAEDVAAGQFHVPIFFDVSNDVDQTGKYFSKYTFQVAPNTRMESYAIASYVEREAKRNNWKTYYTISPDYSFGHSTVDEFLAAMKAYGAHVDVVGQQWPALGATNYSQYISAILSAHPNFVFVGEYGGDLITFTKQAKEFDLFEKSKVYAAYWIDTLEAMGASAPADAITVDRSKSFYLDPSAAMDQFAKTYHSKFGSWPTPWAVLGYTAVETWAQGVKKAGSFDADKVSAALSGAVVRDTLNGTFTLRGCDHQAEVPEYVGVLSKEVSTRYGIRTMTNVYTAPAAKIMMSCASKLAQRKS